MLGPGVHPSGLSLSTHEISGWGWGGYSQDKTIGFLGLAPEGHRQENRQCVLWDFLPRFNEPMHSQMGVVSRSCLKAISFSHWCADFKKCLLNAPQVLAQCWKPSRSGGRWGTEVNKSLSLSLKIAQLGVPIVAQWQWTWQYPWRYGFDPWPCSVG